MQTNIVEQGEVLSSVTPYIFDHTGFHRFPDYERHEIEIAFPQPSPDQDIDPKLLALLVG